MTPDSLGAVSNFEDKLQLENVKVGLNTYWNDQNVGSSGLVGNYLVTAPATNNHNDRGTNTDASSKLGMLVWNAASCVNLPHMGDRGRWWSGN